MNARYFNDAFHDHGDESTRGSLAVATSLAPEQRVCKDRAQRRANNIAAATTSGAAQRALELKHRLATIKNDIVDSILKHASSGGHKFASYLGLCKLQDVTTLLDSNFVSLNMDGTKTENSELPVHDWLIFAAFSQAMNDHTDYLTTPSWVIAFQERKFSSFLQKMEIFENGFETFEVDQLQRGSYGGKITTT